MRQGSVAGSYVQNTGGANSRKLLKNETELYRPFVAAHKLLMFILGPAKLLAVPFPKFVNRLF